MIVEVTRPNPTNFFDAGVEVEPGIDPGLLAGPELLPPPRVVLQSIDGDPDSFSLGRRIGYLDSELGALLVPRHFDAFTTDLVSVPALFTWLVPKTGTHLTAALVHDGLINPGGPPTYYSADGHRVLRWEADRIMRDMMRDAGTGVVRRWLMWSAVTLGTFKDGRETGWSQVKLLSYRVAAVATLALILVLGGWATLDLFDTRIPDRFIPFRDSDLTPVLWWMGERDWWVELLGGLAGAVAIPVLAAPLWGRFWRAGLIAGISLAVLIHATVVLGLLSGSYLLLERLAAWAPRLVLAVGVVLAALAFGFLVVLVV